MDFVMKLKVSLNNNKFTYLFDGFHDEFQEFRVAED